MEAKGEEEAPTPQHWSFWSLPYEIVLSCVARIPKSYYPELCLVSKSFRCLIFSNELYIARRHLQTTEPCVFLCLKLPTRYHPFWFSLWLKETGNLLVPMPSSYTPHLPLFHYSVGSEFYLFDLRNARCSVLSVTNNLNRPWSKTSRMKVPRMNTLVMKELHGKIYVMGGCEPDESTNWAEVFDTKTQTWESLPDPGSELRYSSLKDIHAYNENLYVTTDKKNYVYHPNEGRWEVKDTPLSRSMFMIDSVTYSSNNTKCFWRDSKLTMWKEVKGLDTLDTYDKKDSIEIANYGGKLVMFWNSPNNEIWCAVITLEKHHGSEVWGHIEWVDVVFKAPEASTLVKCVVAQM